MNRQEEQLSIGRRQKKIEHPRVNVNKFYFCYAEIMTVLKKSHELDHPIIVLYFSRAGVVLLFLIYVYDIGFWCKGALEFLMNIQYLFFRRGLA